MYTSLSYTSHTHTQNTSICWDFSKRLEKSQKSNLGKEAGKKSAFIYTTGSFEPEDRFHASELTSLLYALVNAVRSFT